MGLLFRHPSSFGHETGAHPERRERISAIERALEAAGWAGLELREAPRAEREHLRLAHGEGHIEGIERFCAAGGGLIDADTVAVEASWEAALRAAGGAVAAAEAVLAGEASYAFCSLRPPGHHAESDRAMGFCLFNNAAVAAARALDAGLAQRVLILDWDVHHGNGTAEIFAARADVLYASIHQSPLYPGTGNANEVGEGAGEGYTVNLPLPPGSDGDDFLALVQGVVVPIAREYGPSLLVVSAGYDAHIDDPLADCRLLDSDYAALTTAMRGLGDELGAPLLFCLEGGYDLDALARSVLATVRAAAGGAGPGREASSPLTEQARQRLARRWSALR